MRTSTRTLISLLPIAAAAACAVAPPTESVGSSSAAVSPEGSIGSATYQFQLSSVAVGLANDTGGGQFEEYAGIATSVNHAAIQQQGCIIGTGVAGAKLTTCTTNTGATGLLNGQLLTETAAVTAETSTVAVALSLDNIEAVTPSAAASTVNGGLGVGGSIEGIVGTGIAISSAGGPVGGALATIGAIASFASNLFPSSTGPTIGTCDGGLISQNSPAFTTATPWLPGDPQFGIINKPLDTLYQTYTAQQLEALTASGPATITIPVSVSYPATYNGSPVLVGDNYAGACNSAHTITMTVSRVAGTGVATAPLAGNVGVARTSSEFDGFVPDPANSGVALVQWGASGWSAPMATSSAYSLDPWMPSATISRALPPPGQSLVLNSAGTGSVAGTNLAWSLDSFWFDHPGNLYWTSYIPSTGWATTQLPDTLSGISSGNLTATSRNPQNIDVFWFNPYGNLMDSSLSSGWALPDVVGSGAPPGAGVAAISRSFDTMDVFYTGNDGITRDEGFVAGTGWLAPQEVGINDPVGVAGGFVTAVARDANDIDAFFIGKSGAVYQAHYAAFAQNGNGTGWTAPAAITSAAVGTPGGAITAVSRLETTVDLAWVNGTQIDAAEGYGPSSGAPLVFDPAVTITGTPVVNAHAPISLAARDESDMALFFTNIVGQQYAATWVQNTPLSTWQIASPALPACPFGLTLGTSPLDFNVGTNADGETTITATGAAGRTVTLSVTGLPAGVTAQLGSQTLATGSSTWLLLVAAPGTPVQTFDATIVATDGALSNGALLPVTLGACVPTPVSCATACGTVSNGCGGEIVCKACAVHTCQCGGVYPKCDLCE